MSAAPRAASATERRPAGLHSGWPVAPSGRPSDTTELGRMAREAGVNMVIGYHVNPLNGSATMLDMTALYTGRKPAGEQVWSEIIHAVKKEFDGPFVLADDGLVFQVGPAAD